MQEDVWKTDDSSISHNQMRSLAQLRGVWALSGTEKEHPCVATIPIYFNAGAGSKQAQLRRACPGSFATTKLILGVLCRGTRQQHFGVPGNLCRCGAKAQSG